MPDRSVAFVFSNSFLLSAIYTHTHTHLLQVCRYHSAVMFLHVNAQAAGRGNRPITVQLTSLWFWTMFVFSLQNSSVIFNNLIGATYAPVCVAPRNSGHKKWRMFELPMIPSSFSSMLTLKFDSWQTQIYWWRMCDTVESSTTSKRVEF